nr:MAG TPA: restriction alleviation protein [Caudoviricetes sp.]
MSEIKLKPCPFCGSDKVKIRHGDYGVFAECQGCGNRSATVELSSDYTAKTVAIIAWNRRPYPKRPQAYWTRHDLTTFDGKTIKHGAAICSFCGMKLFMPKDSFSYCPNCGAEMHSYNPQKRSKT